ncbi:MAG: hypothetical protein JW717_03375 [Marinilabiliaceae bacterium]|nr:hypothetical protein [Marinilabiliaceae bacterium]
MRQFRFGLFFFAVIILILQLTVVNYTDLSWAENKGSYLGIMSMILIILGVIFPNKDGIENHTKNTE